MIVFAKRVAKKIQAKIACKRVAVVVFGLEVPHAHIHLIPMENEYDVDFRKVKPKFTPEEFEEIATKTFEIGSCLQLYKQLKNRRVLGY